MSKKNHAVKLAALLALAMSLAGVSSPAFAAGDEFDARAKQIVSQMTLAEKIAQLHGVEEKGKQYRIVPGLPRLGIPSLTITNGPAGAGPAGPGHEGPATALPAPISLAATWDVAAAAQAGDLAAIEAATLGNRLLESPDINIARTPHNGRTFESFGEDPILSGELAVANIKAIQARGVVANVKHFAGNNQETNRFNVDDVISPRAFREIYLRAFEMSIIDGHVGSIMGAYNKINGYWCCENDQLLNQILKKDWAFDGFVTSDFGAVHSTMPSARSGLDLELPNGKFFGEPLQAAAAAGEVPIALLDEKLVRRFRTMMRLGVWDKPFDHHDITDGPAHAPVSLAMAVEGTVLLKNENQLLPIKANGIKSVVVIGPAGAKAMTGGDGSSHVDPLVRVSPIDGLKARLGEGVTVSYDDGKDVARAAAAAKAADLAIIALGDHQTEGADHPITLSGNQNELTAAVLAANPKAIVVLKTGGPVLMPWIDQASAVMEVWYPGEEDGAALAAVLFGDQEPTGRLPITFPRRDEDLPASTPAQYPGIGGIAAYSEGLLVGYRWYDAKKIEPLFPFGFGLSYTTFEFSDLRVTPPVGTAPAMVEWVVTNTGKRPGSAVPQLYVGLPSSTDVVQPPKQLKAFQRVTLQPGTSAHVKFPLDGRSLSYWDEAAHGWKVMPGLYQVFAARSSRDIPLTGKFVIAP